jgi:hypothetical protein
VHPTPSVDDLAKTIDAAIGLSLTAKYGRGRAGCAISSLREHYPADAHGD